MCLAEHAAASVVRGVRDPVPRVPIRLLGATLHMSRGAGLWAPRGQDRPGLSAQPPWSLSLPRTAHSPEPALGVLVWRPLPPLGHKPSWLHSPAGSDSARQTRLGRPGCSFCLPVSRLEETARLGPGPWEGDARGTKDKGSAALPCMVEISALRVALAKKQHFLFYSLKTAFHGVRRTHGSLALLKGEQRLGSCWCLSSPRLLGQI